MIDWSQTNRQQKDRVRTIALRNLSYKEKSLWMVASEALCLKRARNEFGIVDENSQIAFVERMTDVYCRGEASVNSMHWNHKPIGFLGELADFALPWKLDYAFLDFTGTFDSRTSHWIASQLAPNINTGADLCFTHTYSWRNNRFIRRFIKNLLNGWSACFKKLESDIDIDEEYVTIPLAMLLSMFNTYRFHVCWPVCYQDHVRSMMFYRLENFRPLGEGTNGWPSLTEVLAYDHLQESEFMNRSEAAKKSWVTRRGNQLAQQRAEIARKSWKTRLANGKTKKAKEVQVTSTEVQAASVIDALVNNKRGAKRLFDSYVDQQVRKGYEEARVRAAIKSHVTRRTI